MKRICVAALLTLSLAACGGSTMSNRAGSTWNDGNRNRTATNSTASDTWGGTVSGGNPNGTVTDSDPNGTVTGNRRTATDTWNETAADSGKTVTNRDGDTGTRSVTERASDALEDGVRRARDGVENAKQSMDNGANR